MLEKIIEDLLRAYNWEAAGDQTQAREFYKSAISGILKLV